MTTIDIQVTPKITPILRLPITPHDHMTPSQAIHSSLIAAETGMQDVIVIGYDVDGHLFIRSSDMTCAEALFLITKAMRWAESGGQS